MSRKIAYIGFGALGKQLSVLIRQTEKSIPEEVYFDDIAVKEKKANAYPFNDYKDERFSQYDFFICLGYKQLSVKGEITATLKKLNRTLPSFIHPTSFINPTATIEAGCIIYPGCNVDQEVVLKEGTFLNNSVIVSHNSVVGAHSFLAPGAIVCGNAEIGTNCFIGAGAVVSNGITVGDNSIVGVGTIVTRDITPGHSVIGNPMRILSTKLELR